MKYLITFTVFLSSYLVMAQKFHTEYKYSDSTNNGITIQNSYPKGGQKYTGPMGKEYIYVVFWTCVTNETNSNLELAINFPNETFTIPSSPTIDFRLYLPHTEMTNEKDNLSNYGLDVKLFLDEKLFFDGNLENPSGLEKTIGPNESYSFYVVAISNLGINGVIRSGFELRKQNLIHKLNDREFQCGQIIVKK